MKRPDASMSLLADVQAEALEPEYAKSTSSRSPALLILASALVALLLTMAVLQTTKGAGAAATQRQEILDRISESRARQAELTAESGRLDQEVRVLGEQAIGDEELRAQLNSAELAAGSVAVTGPGAVLIANDASANAGERGLVLDSDLNQLVNGLWEAGAEAISINGRRLTVLTPIRSAGAAITVDYVSLSPPYRLEAIGDKETLLARFGQTSAANWWNFLTLNYGLTLESSQAEELSLPSDPGMTLRFAQATEGRK